MEGPYYNEKAAAEHAEIAETRRAATGRLILPPMDWRLPRADMVSFMRPSAVTPARTFLLRFKTEAVTPSIVDQAAERYRRWHPSHGIHVNDASFGGSPKPWRRRSGRPLAV